MGTLYKLNFKDNKFFITDKGLRHITQRPTILTVISQERSFQQIDFKKEVNLDNLIKTLLNTLSPREETVIRRRNGINYSPPETLERIGVSFSVTRERIRQIEAKALRKIKHPARFKIVKRIFSKIEEIINSAVCLTENEFLKKLEKHNIKTKMPVSNLKFFLSFYGFDINEKIHNIRGKYYILESGFYRSSLLNTVSKYIRLIIPTVIAAIKPTTKGL